MPCSGVCSWEASGDAMAVLAHKRCLLPDKKILHTFPMRVNQAYLRYLLPREKANVGRFVAEPQRAPHPGGQKGHGHRLPAIPIRIITNGVSLLTGCEF